LLTGYDSAGNIVGSQEKTLAVGAWTQIAIALPGAAKTISYFSVAAKESNSEPIAVDDLGFESEASSTPPPPPPPPPAKPPVANIASLTPSPLPAAGATRERDAEGAEDAKAGSVKGKKEETLSRPTGPARES
jgi:hypothetical protein